MGTETNVPKPIETHYNGYVFRSRLEARWAVFFDALGIKYQYEMEGYALPTAWYLPDFWLADCMWAEVKPREFIFKERQLCLELVQATTAQCLLLAGPPDFSVQLLMEPTGRMVGWKPEEFLSLCSIEPIAPRILEYAIGEARAARFSTSQAVQPLALKDKAPDLVRSVSASKKWPNPLLMRKIKAPSWLIHIDGGFFLDGESTES